MKTVPTIPCAIALVALGILAACAPPSYVIKTPPVTGIKCAATEPAGKTLVAVVDERATKQFSSGRLPGALTFNDAPMDPVQFLATHLGAELASRGEAVETAVGGQGLPKLHLRTFKMENSRSSAFSPFYSHTFLDADLESASGTRRIGIFVQGDKVPVWSFNEVIEPVFNQPMGIVVQELSSKVSAALFSCRASDAQVQELIHKISVPGSATRYMDTYALGFSNNPEAIDTLVQLVKDPDDYVRLAAISSLGTLHATAQMPLLTSIYEGNGALWQEKAMAMKAICDLGTEASKAYTAAEAKRLQTAPANSENGRMAQIVSFGLNK